VAGQDLQVEAEDAIANAASMLSAASRTNAEGLLAARRS